MPPTVMDLSSNNHPGGDPGRGGTPIDWAAVKDSGLVQAVIVKATEGGERIGGQLVGYANPWALPDLQGAMGVGIPGVCYHFARFGVVADELQWFLQNAGALLARALDFEDSTDAEWIDAFLAGLPTLPTLGYGSVANYPQHIAAGALRWIAAWGRGSDPSAAPGDCDLWQYTPSASVPGVPTLVDLSLWVGEMIEYAAVFGPPPAPKASLLIPPAIWRKER